MKRQTSTRFWLVTAALSLTGLLALGILRFGLGLGDTTHLMDPVPWGLWIAFDDLAGIGLAAGGFTIAALVHVLGLKRFRPIVRPSLLTAFLGYVLAVAGLVFDLGQPWRIWHPLVMGNPRSPMWAVAWCVTLGTLILGLGIAPLLLARLGWRRALRVTESLVVPVVVLGALLTVVHQSALGALYVIVPEKMHGLWYTPRLPLLFFLSALSAGLSMVIVESCLSARAWGQRLELELLRDLGRAVALVLALTLALRTQDLVARGMWTLLAMPGLERMLFVVEVVFGAVLPVVLLAIPALRRHTEGLFTGALLVVLGFVLNRMNVAIVALRSTAGITYIPSWLELSVSLLLVLAGVTAFALSARYFRVFPVSRLPRGATPAAVSSRAPGYVRVISRGSLAALGVALIIATGTAPAVTPRDKTTDTATEMTYAGVWTRLPEDFSYADNGKSPGEVIFSHDFHVDPSAPRCGDCHLKGFPLLNADSAPSIRGHVLHTESHCGACHDGDHAFSLAQCGDCHL